MTWRYGPPSVFLTISFDDISNPAAFRLSFRTVDPEKFPEKWNEAEQGGKTYLEALLEEADILQDAEGDIRIPMLYSAWAQKAMDNPIAQVSEYKELLSDVMSILIGIKLNNIETSGLEGRQS